MFYCMFGNGFYKGRRFNKKPMSSLFFDLLQLNLVPMYNLRN